MGDSVYITHRLSLITYLNTTMSQRTIQHKPSKIQAFIWLLALLIIPFSWYFKNGISRFWFKNMECEEPRRREWSSFGVPIPPGYLVHGIDVSHYQCTIDWADVRKMNANGVRVQFAFMRATRGVDFLDYQFQENWAEAKKAKILRGAYHFYKYLDEPARQANFFLNAVDVESGDLPPVLDIERDKDVDDRQLSKDAVLNGIAVWLAIVEKYSGVKPIIYTNIDYYKRYIEGHFPDNRIWIANYDNLRGVTLPDGRRWSFWQVSESARCNGISEKMDFNIYAGTAAQLLALRKP